MDASKRVLCFCVACPLAWEGCQGTCLSWWPDPLWHHGHASWEESQRKFSLLGFFVFFESISWALREVLGGGNWLYRLLVCLHVPERRLSCLPLCSLVNSQRSARGRLHVLYINLFHNKFWEECQRKACLSLCLVCFVNKWTQKRQSHKSTPSTLLLPKDILFNILYIFQPIWYCDIIWTSLTPPLTLRSYCIFSQNIALAQHMYSILLL